MKSAKLFTDFEPYCETIAHADVRMRVLGMEEPRYSIVQTEVGPFGVQWAQEGSGQLSEGATDPDAFGLYVQLNDRPRLLNGVLLDPNAVVVLPPRSEFCFSCDHANSWIAIRLPTELLAAVNDERRDESLETVSVVRSSIDVPQRLRRTVLGFLQATEVQPKLSNSAQAKSLFENEILDIASEICFRSAITSPPTEKGPSLLSRKYSHITNAAAELIEDSLDGSVSVAEIAASLEVSERTLLTAFRSVHDMPPRRFMQSMRLNRARTKLRQSKYPETRIQDIAAECGFWDFGRFAAKYQRLFGELPTQTLKNNRLG